MPHEMPLGVCNCGAVYACDVTGHNLGTAMIDALVFGCNGDWDLAWDLVPEDDYLTREVTDYDYKSHLIIHSKAYEGRNISGVLFFIRLHGDVREVTEAGVKKKVSDATSLPSDRSYKKRGKKPFTKRTVEELVKDYNMDALLSLAKQDKRIIRDLQRLLYSVDDLIRLRAADALGRISRVITLHDPGIISKLLQNLIISITDTAASSWGALDAIGEIIRNNPQEFAAYAPQLYPLMGDRALLAGVLRALSRIIEVKPEAFQKLRFCILPLLKDSEIKIRAYSVITLGDMGSKEAEDDLKGLVNDHEELEIYRDGTFNRVTVGELASRALVKISAL